MYIPKGDPAVGTRSSEPSGERRGLGQPPSLGPTWKPHIAAPGAECRLRAQGSREQGGRSKEEARVTAAALKCVRSTEVFSW